MKTAVEVLVVERDRWLTEWEGTAVRLGRGHCRTTDQAAARSQSRTGPRDDSQCTATGRSERRKSSCGSMPRTPRCSVGMPRRSSARWPRAATRKSFRTARSARGSCVIETQSRHDRRAARNAAGTHRFRAVGWTRLTTLGKSSSMLGVAEQVETILPFALDGTVTRIVGLTVAAAGFPAPLGAICRIHREQGSSVDASRRRLSRRGDAASGLRRPGGRAPRQSRHVAAVGSRRPRRRAAPGPRSRWTRAVYRSTPCSARDRIACPYTARRRLPSDGRGSIPRSARASA